MPTPTTKPVFIGLTIDLSAHQPKESHMYYLLGDILEYQIDAVDNEVFYNDDAPDGFDSPVVSTDDYRITLSMKCSRPEYLEKLLASVKRQTGYNFERATFLQRDFA